MTSEPKDRIAKLIVEATTQVFETMVSVEVTAGEAYVDKKDPGPIAGVVSLVGMVGRWVGTGSFTCSPEMACRIASGLLMADCSAVSEEVLDALAEVANMIIGNVKTGLEEEFGPMGLSIPTVIYGKNFTTRSVGNSEWIVVPFHHREERMEVQVCLAPRKSTQTVPRFWMTGIEA